MLTFIFGVYYVSKVYFFSSINLICIKGRVEFKPGNKNLKSNSPMYWFEVSFFIKEKKIMSPHHCLLFLIVIVALKNKEKNLLF